MKIRHNDMYQILLVEPRVEYLQRRDYASLGALVIFNLINSHPRFKCDYIKLAKKKRFKKVLTQYDFNRYDIIAFSLLTPTSFFNIYPFFLMTGLDPNKLFVIAGGAGILNPLPIAQVVDLIFLGYAEKPLRLFLDLWASGEIKKGLIKPIIGTFSLENNRTYIPWLSDINENLYHGYENLRKYPELEITRGCNGFCHFCQESRFNDIISLPIEKIENVIRSYNPLRNVRLSGPDIFDHPKINFILNLYNRLGLGYPYGVSLKPVKLNKKVIRKLHQLRVKLISTGVEGLSESLRVKAGKPLKNRHLTNLILNCYEAGFRNIRILMILNLPGQGMNDIGEFISIIKNVSYFIKTRFNIKISFTSFIPRPFTYFHDHIFKKSSIPHLSYQKKYLIESLNSINTHDLAISFTKNIVLENDYLAQFVYFGLTDFDDIFKYLNNKGFLFYGNNYSREHSIISSNKEVMHNAYKEFGIDEAYISKAKIALKRLYGG